MAHPLTQHPQSSLPFPAGNRPSPLGFGFAHSSPSFGSSLGFGKSFSSPGGNGSGFPSPSFGFGFGSTSASALTTPTPSSSSSSSNVINPSRPAISPIKPTLHAFKSYQTSSSVTGNQHPSPSRSNSQPQGQRPAQAARLKRSRRSSSSSAASGSSSPPSSATAFPSPRQSHKADLSEVGGLALDDPERRIVRKQIKRVRKDDTAMETSERQDQRQAQSLRSSEGSGADVDLGVLLATLPPTAHLPILLHLLRANPSLESTVLSQIPAPDLNECLATLDDSMSKIRRGLGVHSTSNSSSRPNLAVEENVARNWNRAVSHIDSFCRIASTYLTFFTSPPRSSSPPPEPQTVFNLFQALTSHILFLLHYIPANSPTEASPTRDLLELAKTLLTNWTSWVGALSEEVNVRGGMYPHSQMTTWVEGLDAWFASSSPSSATTFRPTTNSFGGWGQSPSTVPTSNSSSAAASASTTDGKSDHPLVVSFTEALSPIRDKFILELGWVIGRRM